MPFISPFIIRGVVLCPVQSESRCLCLSLVPGSFTVLPRTMLFKKQRNNFLFVCLLRLISNTLKQSFVHHSWKVIQTNGKLTFSWSPGCSVEKKWKHEHFLPTMSINYNNVYKTLRKHTQYACDGVFPLQNIQTIRQETGNLPGKVGVFGGTSIWPAGLSFTFFIWTQQQNGLLIQASKTKRKRAKSPSRTTIGRVITSTKIHVVVRTGTKTKQNFNYNIIPWCLPIHCI